ncbi:MAG: 50S ribosomal protein L11 methyltransferase [Verrucomicrobiia bacterium]
MRKHGGSKKRLIKYEVVAVPQAEEPVCDILNEIFGRYPVVLHNVETGAVSVAVYADEGEFRFGEVKRRFEEKLRLSGVSPESGDFKINASVIRYEDWAESWKRHFKALRFGDVLLVKPHWSKAKVKPGAKVVILNPGLAFGTGQHATTRFCLRQIVKYRPKCRETAFSFLDAGTGSGILAISAAKLGYSPVVAFDYDETAVRIAEKNARRNRVEFKIRLFQQDILRLADVDDEKYDFICANLTADLLIEARKKFICRLKPGGKLALAGILSCQFEAVKKAYQESGLRLTVSEIDSEWESGLFVLE